VALLIRTQGGSALMTAADASAATVATAAVATNSDTLSAFQT